MPATRVLPKAFNPLVDQSHAPTLEQLIERRRLGRTNLSAKPGQVGVANASKQENLGPFDYAHLRVPLPKDLKGSGIFSIGKSNNLWPESYFLMRRSSDGYVSATGMFKAAFPWAKVEEEEAERAYHKTLGSAGHEEVAGNVWIHPEDAFELSKEYNMTNWVLALLDPEPIEKGTKSPERDEIATPPRFILKDVKLPPPASSTRGSTRKRSTRSASPSKIATPVRKMASPRKPRTSRRKKAEDDAASVASSVLQSAIENGTSATDSVDGGPVNGVAESVKVNIDEVVTKEGDKEITKTSVVIDMPAGHPDLPLPENTEDMMAAAKAIVEKATAEDAKSAATNGIKPTRKRKATEVEADDQLAEASGAAKPSEPSTQGATKKSKTQPTKRETVRTRALIGAGLTLAIGAAIPYFL
ncbi:hypothetical protein EJ05DRAFT_97585 [Pseudovirgaria hyperparasitica]|uniref:HTH APSES-type domain-containing protein n=1 Tax=Pseudovirgaria hyperparasitica TaxID=470096 RepID=A0A6A6VYF6_9PEZI|nr:uncharacterized protein EJ05DRAFT_97585 [Pseudovirgaria hyperparasitica]KAF2755303.1 hypothetical protein EJ05DRAFT_97585 [Pseudovirgaria hyperparasitica]